MIINVSFQKNAPHEVCGPQARVHGWWAVLHSWVMEPEKVEWPPAVFYILSFITNVLQFL